MLFDLARFDDRIALYTADGALTYRECADFSARLAASFSGRGLAFLFCTNSAATIVGYVAMLNSGVVPVMVDASLDAELLARLIAMYRPAYLYLPAEQAAGFAGERVGECLGYALVATGEQAPYPLHPELALLMTTSGSTGSPKLVRLSYENIRTNTRQIVEYLAMTEHEVGITNLPLHYVYGLSIINTHLAVGGSLVVTDASVLQREFWQAMRDHAVTNLAGVPYTYELLKKLRFARMKLPALTLLTQAGGKLSPELHGEFAQFAADSGKRFCVMYGAAEATARMGYLPPEQALARVGYMGRAIPGGSFELVGDAGEVITEPGVVGELVYHGANISLGYALCGEDLALGDENHGRYATGDLAERDADGYYRIVGRKKRFLKIFGKRTNLQECEDILKAQFPTTVIACAGVDDRLYVFREGAADEAAAREIIAFLAAKLGLHHSAFAVRSVAEIPRGASGKVRYSELEKYYDL